MCFDVLTLYTCTSLVCVSRISREPQDLFCSRLHKQKFISSGHPHMSTLLTCCIYWYLVHLIPRGQISWDMLQSCPRVHFDATCKLKLETLALYGMYGSTEQLNPRKASHLASSIHRHKNEKQGAAKESILFQMSFLGTSTR